MNSIWAWSFLLGPIALLIVGVLIQYLQNREHLFRSEVFFFSHELALSNLGSLLSAVVVSTRTQDAAKHLTLILLSVVGVMVLLLVATLHKRLHDLDTRPKLRFFMLACFANALGVAALATTLYYTSTPADKPALELR